MGKCTFAHIGQKARETLKVEVYASPSTEQDNLI